MHVSAHAEISGVDDLVGAGVVKNRLGVNTGLVREGTETSDGVVEGDVDLNGLGDHILNLLELVQLISRGDIFVAADNHSCHKATEGLPEN